MRKIIQADFTADISIQQMADDLWPKSGKLLLSSDVGTPTNICTIITRVRPNFEPQILSTMTRRRRRDSSKCLTISIRIQSTKSFLTSHAAAFASLSQTSLRKGLIQSYTYIPSHGVHRLFNLLHPQENFTFFSRITNTLSVRRHFICLSTRDVITYPRLYFLK